MRMYVICHEMLKPEQQLLTGFGAINGLFSGNGDGDFFPQYYDWAGDPEREMIFLDGMNSRELERFEANIKDFADRNDFVIYTALQDTTEDDMAYATVATAIMIPDPAVEMINDYENYLMGKSKKTKENIDELDREVINQLISLSVIQ